MYRTFEHDGKAYRLEYSLEAYLEKYVDEDGKRTTHVAPLVKLTNEKEEAVTTMFDMPEIAIHAMYAGLLRWHGRGKRGDKTITTFDAAAELCMELIDGHPDDEYLGSWGGLINMCSEQLEEDDFFNKYAGAMIPEDKEPEKKPKAKKS